MLCKQGRRALVKHYHSLGSFPDCLLGFKAVFVVAHRVHVASGPFTFLFDRNACLGMVNPIWDASHGSIPGWTTFRLSIAQTVNRSDLKDQVKGIKPTLLLFLRKLRSLDVEIYISRCLRISLRRVDESNEIVKLERRENGVCVSTERYIVVRRLVRTYTGEEKRQGIQQSEVVLAFPIDASDKPIIDQQYVHAFLPVATYGLPVCDNLITRLCTLTSVRLVRCPS